MYKSIDHLGVILELSDSRTITINIVSLVDSIMIAIKDTQPQYAPHVCFSYTL